MGEGNLEWLCECVSWFRCVCVCVNVCVPLCMCVCVVVCDLERMYSMYTCVCVCLSACVCVRIGRECVSNERIRETM